MDRSSSKKVEIAAVAKKMLFGEMDLIDGVRRICLLRFDSGDPENPVFLVLRAIESETDHFPSVETRELCAADYLQRIDVERDSYLSHAKPDILQACREIIRAFS